MTKNLDTFDADITNVRRGIIVHQVNCQGVMGSGVAKALYTKWPEVKKNFLEYSRDLRYTQELLGTIQQVYIEDDLVVVNGFSQFDYGASSRRYTSYDAVDNVFRQVAYLQRQLDLPVYVPYNYGCGLGGGDWNIVETIIASHCPKATAVRLPVNLLKI